MTSRNKKRTREYKELEAAIKEQAIIMAGQTALVKQHIQTADRLVTICEELLKRVQDLENRELKKLKKMMTEWFYWKEDTATFFVFCYGLNGATRPQGDDDQ